MLKVTSDGSFEKDTAKGLSFTDFGASWCGPCRMEAPVIKKLASQLDGKVNFFTIDVDKNKETPQKFGIMGIPTMIIKKNGKVVDSITGYHSGTQLKKLLEKQL